MHSVPKRLFFLLLYFIICLHGNSQDLTNKLRLFTAENDLSGNVVYAIHQDIKGYLWIGTHEGLYQYNGYTYKNFQHSSLDTNSISDNRINNIYEDGPGNIWLSTNGGLCRYSHSTGNFTHINLPGIRVIRQVVAVNANELLLFAAEEIYVLNIKTLATIRANYYDNGTLKYTIYTEAPLVNDGNGNIYLAQKKGNHGKLWRFDASKKTFFEFCNVSFKKEINNQDPFYFFIDTQKRFWFGTTNAISVYDKEVTAGEDISTDLLRLMVICSALLIPLQSAQLMVALAG